MYREREREYRLVHQTARDMGARPRAVSLAQVGYSNSKI